MVVVHKCSIHLGVEYGIAKKFQVIPSEYNWLESTSIHSHKGNVCVNIMGSRCLTGKNSTGEEEQNSTKNEINMLFLEVQGAQS